MAAGFRWRSPRCCSRCSPPGARAARSCARRSPSWRCRVAQIGKLLEGVHAGAGHGRVSRERSGLRALGADPQSRAQSRGARAHRHAQHRHRAHAAPRSGAPGERRGDPCRRCIAITAHFGFMETPDIGEALRACARARPARVHRGLLVLRRPARGACRGRCRGGAACSAGCSRACRSAARRRRSSSACPRAVSSS